MSMRHPDRTQDLYACPDVPGLTKGEASLGFHGEGTHRFVGGTSTDPFGSRLLLKRLARIIHERFRQKWKKTHDIKVNNPR
jgi:hypothetical protein